MGSAKLTLTVDPLKQPKAWLCDIKDQGAHWFPFTCITAWNPATKEIKIQTWMLKQKGIKFKV